MKNWNDLIAVMANLAPPFFASLTGAAITFLMNLRRRKNELRDVLLEAAFCVPFGTLFGYIVDLFGGHYSWSIAAASLGGMFGEKIYARLSKRVETIGVEDILDPLSMLASEHEKTEKHKDNHMTKKNNKGYFIGIGLNGVKTENYNGWDGKLNGAVNDIQQLSSLAKLKDFEIQTLLDKSANADNVRGVLDDVKLTAKEGDTVWIAYSGHGGQIKNSVGRQLETYCFYDGQMADFEMLNHIAGFPKGVKVILSLDCCHSGGFDRKMFGEMALIAKSMPKDIQIGLQSEHFSQIKQGINEANINMNGGQNLLILAACQKSEVAYDGAKNGLFTAAMLKIHLSDEALTYTQLVEKVSEICEPNQKPRLVARPKTSTLCDQTHFTI